MQPQKQEKSKRLETRITVDQHALIQQAAALEGQSVSNFVIHILQAAAKAIIQEHAIIHLSTRDQVDFANALLNPKPPNKKLRDAHKRHL